MRILAIHSDYITIELKKKAIKSAEEKSKESIDVKDCLVIFTSVEKADETNVDEASRLLVKEVENIAEQIKEKRIVLYPYAHLSSDLSKDPNTAISVLTNAETLLKEDGYEVHRAEFGWYKAFKISCKGHPLSELSREFVPVGAIPGKRKEVEQDISEALKKEEELTSTWFILTPDGKEHPIELKKGKISGFTFTDEFKNLKKLIKYEIKKDRKVEMEPPHVPLMKKFEIANYEPASDPGNLRYPPKGFFMKSQIADLVTQNTVNYGAMAIEAPIMYDYEHPTLKSYLNRFPARQYTVNSPNKRLFLRFAACFGQFLMAKDMFLTHKHLPLRLYEMTRYSFRVEQRGELTGLRRLRCFTMPDCHAFCSDLDMVKSELEKRFELARSTLEACGLPLDDFEFAIRIVKDFYEKNKDFVQEFVKRIGKPVLVEMWNQRFFYFIFKYEWNFVDALDKASTLATDQIDVENAERYGITYLDENEEKKYPLIMHLSPTGAVERVLYALLEKAHIRKKQGLVPMFPVWLSPTVIRLLPISEEHLALATELADTFTTEGIRTDIDDRGDSVGKKIRNAEAEWIPYIIVIGDKEVQSKGKELKIRIREEKAQKDMKLSELIDRIKKELADKPNRPLPHPRLLSTRPKFS
ncbi:MAG: threonine--tRNA ligase [Candidatus Helarchaeota archaeon]